MGRQARRADGPGSVRCVVAAVVGVVSALVVVSAPAPSTSASPGPPSTVFDPAAVGWDLLRDLPGTQFDNEVGVRRAGGLMVIDLEAGDHNDLIPNVAEPADKDGKEHPRRSNVFSAVFQRNIDGRATRVRRDMTRTQFRDEIHRSQGENKRLIDLEVYASDTDPDKALYAGVWVENRENLRSPFNAIVYDIDESLLESIMAANRDVGMMPIDVEEYSVADCEHCFSMIFVENREHLGWSAVFGETDTHFRQYFNANNQLRYRMVAVASQVRFNGDIGVFDSCRYVPFDDCEESTAQSYYGGIWVQDPARRAWAEYRGLDAATLTRRLDELTTAGFRPISLEMYKVRAGQACWHGDDWHADSCKNRYVVRYAVIFRQNRPGASLPTTTTTTTTTAPPPPPGTVPPSRPGDPPRHEP
jgi:hypothetical protein